MLTLRVSSNLALPLLSASGESARSRPKSPGTKSSENNSTNHLTCRAPRVVSLQSTFYTVISSLQGRHIVCCMSSIRSANAGSCQDIASLGGTTHGIWGRKGVYVKRRRGRRGLGHLGRPSGQDSAGFAYKQQTHLAAAQCSLEASMMCTSQYALRWYDVTHFK